MPLLGPYKTQREAGSHLMMGEEMPELVVNNGGLRGPYPTRLAAEAACNEFSPRMCGDLYTFPESLTFKFISEIQFVENNGDIWGGGDITDDCTLHPYIGDTGKLYPSFVDGTGESKLMYEGTVNVGCGSIRVQIVYSCFLMPPFTPDFKRYSFIVWSTDGSEYIYEMLGLTFGAGVPTFDELLRINFRGDPIAIGSGSHWCFCADGGFSNHFYFQITP